MNPLASLVNDGDVNLRLAQRQDVTQLVALEQTAFKTDQLSARSFRRWVASPHGVLLLAEQGAQLLGYGLVWCHKGTQLARLYSLAVSPQARGLGLGKQLLQELESQCLQQGYFLMRLEVAKGNVAAITLYESMGYRVFGEYLDYYDDHGDALRMQKNMRQRLRQQKYLDHPQGRDPWYQQTTEFTCGPASLLMAMNKVNDHFEMNQREEINIWREATTVFMTSGHGGCHPLGLALSAHRRGFEVEVVMNTASPLFIEGVRDPNKKAIMALVHEEFLAQSQQVGLSLSIEEVSQGHLDAWLERGASVLVLISTYRLDGKKAPHWVMISGADERCFYLHDPDLGDDQQPMDCQHLPIAREDFEKMSAFGRGRLRTALAVMCKSEQ